MNKEQIKRCVSEGDKFAEKGEWDKAIDYYEKALEENPVDREVHERIVRMYIHKRDRHGYLEALSRYNRMKDPSYKKSAPAAKPPSSGTPRSGTPTDLPSSEERAKPAKEPPAPPVKESKPFVSFQPPPYQPPPVKEPPTKAQAPKEPPAKEPPKTYAPPEFLRKEPPPRSLELRPEAAPPPTSAPPPKSEPAKPPSAPPPRRTEKAPIQLPETKQPLSAFEKPAAQTPEQEKTIEEEARASVTEADLVEADAKQMERQGKKDQASKTYLQAAKLWEQKGDKEKAGVAYEKAYDLAPSMETLSRLNELYGQGVRLKQSTVMEIYRRIYHMKV